MFNLIRKDLLMFKTGFPVYLTVLTAVMLLQTCRGFSASLCITFYCIYGTILPTALIAIEDRVRAWPFNCSLPATRRQIVQAKYVISWCMAVILTLIGLVLYSLIAADGFREIWTVTTAGQALVTLSLSLAVTLPILLRFGWWGLIGGFFAWITLWVVTLPLIRVLFPDVRLLDTFIAISNFIAGARAQLGAPLFLITILVAGVSLNLVSCQIAIVLFKQREF